MIMIINWIHSKSFLQSLFFTNCVYYFSIAFGFHFGLVSLICTSERDMFNSRTNWWSKHNTQNYSSPFPSLFISQHYLEIFNLEDGTEYQENIETVNYIYKRKLVMNFMIFLSVMVQLYSNQECHNYTYKGTFIEIQMFINLNNYLSSWCAGKHVINNNLHPKVKSSNTTPHPTPPHSQ